MATPEREADNPILRRVLRQLGQPRLFEALTRELSLRDLNSLLLLVLRERARDRPLEALVAAAERDASCAPSPVDARVFARFDRTVFDCAPDFDAIELAPTVPLGMTHALGGTDPGNVLGALRGLELLGDSTTALALEAARRRRRAGPSDPTPVRLCASQRVMRRQRVEVPGYSPHFRLLALMTAARAPGAPKGATRGGPEEPSEPVEPVELWALREHLHFYLTLIQTLAPLGYGFFDVKIEISDTEVVAGLLQARGVSLDALRGAVSAHLPGGSQAFLAARGITLPVLTALAPDAVKSCLEREVAPQLSPSLRDSALARLGRIEESVCAPLRKEFGGEINSAKSPLAGLRIGIDLSRLEGLAYYRGPCLRLSARNAAGQSFALGDGGFTDWLARLLGSRRERVLTSGLGTELICKLFRGQ